MSRLNVYKKGLEVKHMDKKNPKKILRQQLELLAEHSEGATEQELPNLSAAMCEIYDRLIQEGVGRSLFRSAIILVTLANLLVSILILIQ